MATYGLSANEAPAQKLSKPAGNYVLRLIALEPLTPEEDKFPERDRKGQPILKLRFKFRVVDYKPHDVDEPRYPEDEDYQDDPKAYPDAVAAYEREYDAYQYAIDAVKNTDVWWTYPAVLSGARAIMKVYPALLGRTPSADEKISDEVIGREIIAEVRMKEDSNGKERPVIMEARPYRRPRRTPETERLLDAPVDIDRVPF